MVLAATFRSRALSLAKNCSVAQLGAGSLDGFADAGGFVAGEIVHHNDIVLAQDRDHEVEGDTDGRVERECPDGPAWSKNLACVETRCAGTGRSHV